MPSEVYEGRPDLPQIDLNVVEIDGGGSCPTQFEGQTDDGSPIYIRYRGGVLSISKGEPGMQLELSAMRQIYKEVVGPAYHGDILLEQVSDLTGLRVKGEKLSLSECATKRVSLTPDRSRR